jgi:hypothetical protein
MCLWLRPLAAERSLNFVDLRPTKLACAAIGHKAGQSSSSETISCGVIGAVMVSGTRKSERPPGAVAAALYFRALACAHTMVNVHIDVSGECAGDV